MNFGVHLNTEKKMLKREKIDKYSDLSETCKSYGTVSRSFEKSLGKMEIRGRIENIQTTDRLEYSEEFGRSDETWCHSDSTEDHRLKLVWKTLVIFLCTFKYGELSKKIVMLQWWGSLYQFFYEKIIEIEKCNIYIYIYIYASSSCRAASMDFPNFLSLLLPLSLPPPLSLSLSPFVFIVHHFRHVFQTTSCVRTELV